MAINMVRPVPKTGRLIAWQIKDFPADLRDHITALARRSEVTVADFLIGYFEAHGLDPDLTITRWDRPAAPPDTRTPAELRELAEIAAILRSAGMVRAAGRIARSVAETIAPPQGAPRRFALAPPEHDC